MQKMGQKKRESSKGTGEKREKKREREKLDHEDLKQNWVKRSAKNIAGKLTLKRKKMFKISALTCRYCESKSTHEELFPQRPKKFLI